MLTMDIFNHDAFSAVSLTAAVDCYGYVPTTLATIPGLTIDVPVATRDIFIERRANAPALIQTSPLGSPPSQKGSDKSDVRAFRTRRLALGSRITAEELQGIRAFGSDSELASLQSEIARRTLKIKQDFALTRENWLLGMVQGKLLDADQSIIYDWAAEFGQTIPAEVPFAFSATVDIGMVRITCAGIRRTMTRNLQGMGGDSFEIVALCGDQFWDELTGSAEVVATYKHWAAAEDLRNIQGRAWSAFRYGDINFMNYRGTDDNSTVAIPTDKAKIFPIGAGIFQRALAPAERFEFVNTKGRDMYSWIIFDEKRHMYADLECASYPLAICVQPQALASARAGA